MGSIAVYLIIMLTVSIILILIIITFIFFYVLGIIRNIVISIKNLYYKLKKR